MHGPSSPGGATVLAENLGRAALPAESFTFALSPPTFRPGAAPASAGSGGAASVDGYFVCGTEIQPSSESDSAGGRGPGTRTAAAAAANRLVFSKVNFEAAALQRRDDGTTSVWTYTVSDPVSCLRWLDSEHFVAALDKHLSVCSVEEWDDDSVRCALVDLPGRHADTIRDMQVHPASRNLVLSGGFDGTVVVTDLQADDTAARAAPMYEYDSGDVVGSLRWLDEHTVSCTNDGGMLQVLDLRAPLRTAATLFDTGKVGLYSHAHTPDCAAAVLGFADASLMLYDRRAGKVLMRTRDNYQQSIGDVCIGPGTSVTVESARDGRPGACMVLCGHPGLSVWGVGGDLMLHALSHHRAADIDMDARSSYRIAGDFVNGSSLFAAADSVGSVLLLNTAV